MLSFKAWKHKCSEPPSGIVLCFGGGVLVATVFLHMLGEVAQHASHLTT
jgi:hypothetical protein